MDPQIYLPIANRTIQSSLTSMAPSFESIVIPQVVSASISFAASTTMVITIALTGLRLSVPYRRIIFGLGIADMVQSLGFLTGPIAVPRTIPDSWGLGDEVTCKTSGFFVTLGLLAAPAYICFVCWYYLCKLKYRMSDEAFAHRRERKIHAFIMVLVMVLALAALMMDTLHPVPSKTYCHLAATPLGCRYFASEECDATITALVDVFWNIIISLQLASILGVVVMMGMIYRHVIRQNRIYQPQPRQPSSRHQDAENVVTSNETQQNAAARHHNAQQVLHLTALYRNEIALQATCYVGAFILSYIPLPVIHFLVVAGITPPKIFIIMTMSLLPLGGLFNILVYSRPKAASLRRAHPDYSRILCLWLVLRFSGEIPNRPFQGERGSEQQDNGPRFSISSIDPIGVIGISSSGLSLSEGGLNFIAENGLSLVDQGGSTTDLDRTQTTVKMNSDVSQLDLR